MKFKFFAILSVLFLLASGTSVYASDIQKDAEFAPASSYAYVDINPLGTLFFARVNGFTNGQPYTTGFGLALGSQSTATFDFRGMGTAIGSPIAFTVEAQSTVNGVHWHNIPNTRVNFTALNGITQTGDFFFPTRQGQAYRLIFRTNSGVPIAIPIGQLNNVW